MYLFISYVLLGFMGTNILIYAKKVTHKKLVGFVLLFKI